MRRRWVCRGSGVAAAARVRFRMRGPPWPGRRVVTPDRELGERGGEVCRPVRHGRACQPLQRVCMLDILRIEHARGLVSRVEFTWYPAHVKSEIAGHAVRTDRAKPSKEPEFPRAPPTSRETEPKVVNEAKQMCVMSHGCKSVPPHGGEQRSSLQFEDILAILPASPADGMPESRT